MRDPRFGIITSGIAYQYVREVAPGFSTFKLGMSYPLPRKRLLEFAAACDEIRIVEELEPIFEQKLATYGLLVNGKDRIPVIGELSPEIVRKALEPDRPVPRAVSSLGSLPVRPPVLCPGCHHRGPFSVLSKLGLHVAGDIGCYTLAAFSPLDAMDTCICMGASIGMALGFEKARGREFAKKTVAVIGDSTFWHSGVTGLIDVVYNRGITTVIILDNSTTAMTGHQSNPSSGDLVSGTLPPKLDFIALARSLGIESVREVDAYNLVELEAVISEEVEREAPSVIVTRRACLLKRGVSPPGPPNFVDMNQCEACGTCLELGCPALSMAESVAAIDSTLCAGCGLCLSSCAFDAIHPALISKTESGSHQ
jgi:indolepyruvate ferredoxin oxidoreductase alpha subunit